MVCTFFGHRFISDKTEPALRSALADLIENRGVDLFYVGNHGSFDGMVRRVLRELSKKYEIRYFVVLAYIPEKRDGSDHEEYSDTILPDGIETVPKRFAVTYRNKWMLRGSDYVVTYVTHEIGSGAAQFKHLAEKWGKTVIELG